MSHARAAIAGVVAGAIVLGVASEREFPQEVRVLAIALVAILLIPDLIYQWRDRQ